MATRIDHSGHPHPSTPAARQLCRANGGTGSTAKTGTKAPQVTKRSVAPPPSPRVIKDISTGKPISREDAFKEMFGFKPNPPKPSLTESKIPVARPVALPDPRTKPTMPGGAPGPTRSVKPRAFKPESMQIKGDDGKWHNVAKVDSGSIVSFRDSKGNLITSSSPVMNVVVRDKSAAGMVVPTKAPGPVGSNRVPLPPGTSSIGSKVDKGVNPRIKKAVVDVAKVQEGLLGKEYVDKAINVIDQPEVLDQYAPANAGSNNSFAIFTFRPRRLSLHKNLHNRTDELERCGHSGWFAKGGSDSMENVLAHEMGHAFASTDTMSAEGWNKLIPAMIEHLGLDARPPDINPGLGKGQAGLRANTWFRDVIKGPNKGKVKRGISAYSTTNINEFIAEVWQSYSMNEKPNKKTQAIGDVLKDVMVSGGTDVISNARR